MDVTFSMWDLAGQEVYYATHQCFLSRNTLYLVVWNMTEGEQGIDYLRPWLLNVQVMWFALKVTVCVCVCVCGCWDGRIWLCNFIFP